MEETSFRSNKNIVYKQHKSRVRTRSYLYFFLPLSYLHTPNIALQSISYPLWFSLFVNSSNICISLLLRPWLFRRWNFQLLITSENYIIFVGTASMAVQKKSRVMHGPSLTKYEIDDLVVLKKLLIQIGFKTGSFKKIVCLARSKFLFAMKSLQGGSFYIRVDYDCF